MMHFIWFKFIENCLTFNDFKKLSHSVSSAINEGHVPVVLGGDHSLAIGSVSGTASALGQIGLIWIDAHADINTPCNLCVEF